MNIKTIILMCLIIQVLPNNGLVQLQSSLATSDSPLLMKILQSVDAATSDEHLLEVTLKLLRSLCVCMRETLKAKEEKFNIENNSLEPNDSSGTDGKVLDLYRKIYNNTCFNLRQELTNRTHKSLIDEETAFLNHTNCGKEVKNETESIHDASDKVPPVANPISSKLEHILFQALIQTKDYHKYRIKRYNILGKSKLQTKNALQHRIIVILTLHPDAQEIFEKSYNVVEKDLNKTLHTRSPIDIDIIDPKHNKKLVENEKIKKLDNFSDCNILSLYKFLAESEQNNLTKVFKFLRKRETIKIYIEVDIGPNHTDYIDVCCNNGTLNPHCNKDFQNDSNEIKNKEIKSKVVQNDYKKTITKIKHLVKLYEDKLNDTSDRYNNSGRIYGNQQSKEKTIKPDLESTTKQINTIADHVYQHENDIQKLVSDSNDPFKLGEVTRAILLLNNFVSKQTTKKVLKLQPTTDNHEEFARHQQNNTTTVINHSIPNQNMLHQLFINQSITSLPIHKNKNFSTESHMIGTIFNKSAGLTKTIYSHLHVNEILGVTLPMSLATDGGKDERQEMSDLKLDIENFVNNTFTIDISATDLAITDFNTGSKQDATKTKRKLSTVNHTSKYDEKPSKITFPLSKEKMGTETRLPDLKISDKAIGNFTDYQILRSTENKLPFLTNQENLFENTKTITPSIDKTEKRLLTQLGTTSDDFRTVKEDSKYKKANYLPTLTTLKPFSTITINNKWRKIRKRPNLSKKPILLKTSVSKKENLRPINVSVSPKQEVSKNVKTITSTFGFDETGLDIKARQADNYNNKLKLIPKSNETYRASSRHHIFQEITNNNQINLNKATLKPASKKLSTAFHKFEDKPLRIRPAHTVKDSTAAGLITTPALRVTFDELDESLKNTPTKEMTNNTTFIVEDNLDAGTENNKSNTINESVLKTSILSFDTTLKPMSTAKDINPILPKYEADNEIFISKPKDFLTNIILETTDDIPVTKFISTNNIQRLNYYGNKVSGNSYLSSSAPNITVRGLFDNKHWMSNYLKKSGTRPLTESPIHNKKYFVTDFMIPTERQKLRNPNNNIEQITVLSEKTILLNENKTSDMQEIVNRMHEQPVTNYKKYLLEPVIEEATISGDLIRSDNNERIFKHQEVDEGVLIVNNLLLNEPIEDEIQNERNTESMSKFENYVLGDTQNTGTYHSPNHSKESLYKAAIGYTLPVLTKPTLIQSTKLPQSDVLKRITDIERIIERPVILMYNNHTLNVNQSITNTSGKHTENTPEISSSTPKKKVVNLSRPEHVLLFSDDKAKNHFNGYNSNVTFDTGYKRHNDIFKIGYGDDKIATRPEFLDKTQVDTEAKSNRIKFSVSNEKEKLLTKSALRILASTSSENNSTQRTTTLIIQRDPRQKPSNDIKFKTITFTPKVQISNEIETNSYDKNLNIPYMNLTRKSNVMYNNEDLTRIASILHKLSGNPPSKIKANNTLNSTMRPMKKTTASVANVTSHGRQKSSQMNTTTKLLSKTVNNKKVTHVKHISRKPGALTDNLGIEQFKSVYLDNMNTTGKKLNKSEYLNISERTNNISTTNILKKLYEEVISLKKNNQLKNSSHSNYISGNNNTVDQLENAEKIRNNLVKIAKILHAKNGPIIKEKYEKANKPSYAPSKKDKKLKKVLNDLLKGKKLNKSKRKRLNKKRLRKKLKRLQKSHINIVKNNTNAVTTKNLTRMMTSNITTMKTQDLTETEYRQFTKPSSFVDNKINKTDILLKNNTTKAMLMHEILNTSRKDVAKDTRRNFGTSNSDNFSSDQAELISSESENILHNTSMELNMGEPTPNNVTPKTSVSRFWGMILDETREVENSSKGSENQAKTNDVSIQHNLIYLPTIRPNVTYKLKLTNISNSNVTISKKTQVDSDFSKNYSQKSNSPRVKEILDTINDIQQSVDQLLLTINDTTMNKGDFTGAPSFSSESSYKDKNTSTSNGTERISVITQVLSTNELKNNTNKITLSMIDLINTTEATHTFQNVFDSVDDLIQELNDVLTEDTKNSTSPVASTNSLPNKSDSNITAVATSASITEYEYNTQNVTNKREQQVNEETYLNHIEFTTDSKYLKYTVPLSIITSTAFNASEFKLDKNTSNFVFMSSPDAVTEVPTQNYNPNKNTQPEYAVTMKNTSKEYKTNNVVNNMTENVDENKNGIDEISFQMNLNSMNTGKVTQLVASTSSDEQSLQQNEQITEKSQLLTVKTRTYNTTTATELINEILPKHETSLEANTLTIMPSNKAVNVDILELRSEIMDLSNEVNTVNGTKTERPNSMFPIHKSEAVSTLNHIRTPKLPNNDISTKTLDIAILKDKTTHQYGQSLNSVTAEITTKPYHSKNKSISIQSTLLRTDILNNDPSQNEAVTIYKMYDIIEATTGTPSVGSSNNKNKETMLSTKSEEKSLTLQSKTERIIPVKIDSTDANIETFEESYLKKRNVSEEALSTDKIIEKLPTRTDEDNLETNESFLPISLKVTKLHKDNISDVGNVFKNKEKSTDAEFLILTDTIKSPNESVFINKSQLLPTAESSNVTTDVLVVDDDSVDSIIDKEKYEEIYNDKPSNFSIVTSPIGYPGSTLTTDEDYPFNEENGLFEDGAVSKNTINTSNTEPSSLATFIHKTHKSEETTPPYSVAVDFVTVSATNLTTEANNKIITDNEFDEDILSKNETITVDTQYPKNVIKLPLPEIYMSDNKSQEIIISDFLHKSAEVTSSYSVVVDVATVSPTDITREEKSKNVTKNTLNEETISENEMVTIVDTQYSTHFIESPAAIIYINNSQEAIISHVTINSQDVTSPYSVAIDDATVSLTNITTEEKSKNITDNVFDEGNLSENETVTVVNTQYSTNIIELPAADISKNNSQEVIMSDIPLNSQEVTSPYLVAIDVATQSPTDTATEEESKNVTDNAFNEETISGNEMVTIVDTQYSTNVIELPTADISTNNSQEVIMSDVPLKNQEVTSPYLVAVHVATLSPTDIATKEKNKNITDNAFNEETIFENEMVTIVDTQYSTNVIESPEAEISINNSEEVIMSDVPLKSQEVTSPYSVALDVATAARTDITMEERSKNITDNVFNEETISENEMVTIVDTPYSTNVIESPEAENSINNSQEVIMSDVPIKSQEVTSRYLAAVDTATESPTDITTEEKSKNITDNAFNEETISENETVIIVDTRYSTNVLESPAAKISINNSQEVIMSDVPLKSQDITSPYSVAVDVATVSLTDINTEEKSKNLTDNALNEETLSENETVTVINTQYSTNIIESPAAEISINKSDEVIMSNVPLKSQDVTSPYSVAVDVATVSLTDLTTEEKSNNLTDNEFNEETISENETVTVINTQYSTNIIESPAAEIYINDSEEVMSEEVGISDVPHRIEEVTLPYSVVVDVATVSPTDINTEEKNKVVAKNAFYEETLSKNETISVVDNQYSTSAIKLLAAEISINNSQEVIMSDALITNQPTIWLSNTIQKNPMVDYTESVEIHHTDKIYEDLEENSTTKKKEQVTIISTSTEKRKEISSKEKTYVFSSIEDNSTKSSDVKKFRDHFIGEIGTTFGPLFRDSYNKQDNGNQSSNNTLNQDNFMETKKVSGIGFINTESILPNTSYVETLKSKTNGNSNDLKRPPSFSEKNADNHSIISSTTMQQSNASTFIIKTTETISPFKVQVLNASLFLVKNPSTTMHTLADSDVSNSLNKQALKGTVAEQQIDSKTEPTFRYFNVYNETTVVIHKIKHFDVIDETTSKFVAPNKSHFKYNEKINDVDMTTTEAKSLLTKMTDQSYLKQNRISIMDNKERLHTDPPKSTKSSTLTPLNTTAKIFILDANTRETVLNRSVINTNRSIQVHNKNDAENNKIRSKSNVNKNANQNATPSHKLIGIKTNGSKVITNTMESPAAANKTMPLKDTKLRKNIMFKMKTDTSKALKLDIKARTNGSIPGKIKSIYYSRDTIESSDRNTSKMLQGNSTSNIKFVVKIHDGTKNISYIHTPELTHVKVTKLKPVNKTNIQELLPVSQDKINNFRSYSTNKSEGNYDGNFKSFFTDIDGGKFKGEKSVQIFSSRVYRPYGSRTPATAVTKNIKYNTYQPTTKEDLELLNYDNQPLLKTRVHTKGDEKSHDGKPHDENPAVNNSCSVLRNLKNKFSSVKEFMEVLKAANCTEEEQINYEKHERNIDLHLSQEINKKSAEVNEKTHSIEIDKISNPILEININSPQIGTNADSPPMIEIKGNPLPMEIKRNLIPVVDVSGHAMEIIKNPHLPIDIRRNSKSMMEIMDPLLIQNNGNALQMEINKNSPQLNEINRNSPSLIERNGNISPVVDVNQNKDRNSPIMEFKKNQPPVINIIRHFPLFMEINRNSPPIEIYPNGSTIAINKYLRWNPSVIGIGRDSPSMVSTIDMNSPQMMVNNVNNYRNSPAMVDINSNSDMNKNAAQISGINNNLPPKDDTKSNSPAVDNTNGSPTMIGINRNSPPMLEMNRNLPPTTGINSNSPPMVDNRKPYSMVEMNNMSPAMIDITRNSLTVGDVNRNLAQVGDINRNSYKMVNNNGNAQAMADMSVNAHSMLTINRNSSLMVDVNRIVPSMDLDKNYRSTLDMGGNSPLIYDINRYPPSMINTNRNPPQSMVDRNRNRPVMAEVNNNSPSMVEMSRNSQSMVDIRVSPPSMFEINRHPPSFFGIYRSSPLVFDINRNSPSVVDMSRKSPSLADMSRNSQQMVHMNNNLPTVDMNKNSPSTLDMGRKSPPMVEINRNSPPMFDTNRNSPSIFDMNRNYSPSMLDMNRNSPSMADINRNSPSMVDVNNNSPSVIDINSNSPSTLNMNRNSASMVDMNRNSASMVDMNRNSASMVDMNRNSASMVDINRNSASMVDMNRNSAAMVDMNRNPSSNIDINRNLPAMVDVNRNLPSTGFYRNSPSMVDMNRNSASMLDINNNLPTRVDNNRNPYTMVEINNNSPAVIDITRNALTVADVNGNSPQMGDTYRNSPAMVDMNRNPPSMADMNSHSMFNTNKNSPLTNSNRNSPIKNERSNDTDNKSYQAVESRQNIPTTIQNHSTNDTSKISHPIIRSNVVRIPKPLKNKKSNLAESRKKVPLKKESKTPEINGKLHPIVEIHRNTHPPIEINRNVGLNIVTNNFKRTGFKKDTFLNPFRKTNSYTPKAAPPKPPRKPMKLMKLGTRRKEVMTMNTQDFFSQHRVVTQQNVVRKFSKPNSLFFKPKPIPKFSVLHPKFDSIDKAKRLEHIMRPKPLYIQPTDDAFEEELIKHHRPDTSKWHKNLVHNFQSVGVVKNNARINNVLDRPLWQTTSKPKINDRMNAMRKFLYTADYSKVTRRPIFNEVLRVPLDSNDSNDNYKPSAFYHRRPDDEDTTTEAVRTPRPRRTIFFLSPTLAYNQYN